MAAVLPAGPLSVRGQETGPIIAFAQDFFVADENGAIATITVSRTGDLIGPANVRYQTTNVTALLDADYRAASGTITFAAGETNKTFTVAILDDPDVEGDEVVRLTLSEPSVGASLGESSTARLIISDNEKPGVVLDTAFRPNLADADSINAILVEPDGDILAAGIFSRLGSATPNRVLRFRADGTLDSSFAGTGPDGDVLAVAVLADGKVLIGGDFARVGSLARRRIARLNANGLLDASFNPGSGVEGPVRPGVYSITVQPDGKILLSGLFSTVSGASRNSIARLNADGSLDASFDPGSGTSGSNSNFMAPWISAVVLQPDGKIIVGGQFTEFNGTARNNIARLHADGSLDATFDPRTGATGQFSSVESLARQTDGKIVLGGDFLTVNGTPRVGLARLEVNGVLDPSLDPGPGVQFIDPNDDVFVGTVTGLAIQPDGKIWAGGNFNVVNGFLLSGIARVKSDGAVDPEFDSGPGTMFRDERGFLDIVTLDALALQPDGKMLIAASFRSANGATVNRFARLLPANRLDSMVEWNVGSLVLGENAGQASLQVIRRGRSADRFSVDFATVDRSTTASADYIPQRGTLTFAPLEVEKTIEVQIRRDGAVEEDESFELTLSNPTSSTVLGGLRTAVITLLDSERPGSVDPDFAAVNIPFPDQPDQFLPVNAIQLLPDGKILFSGHFSTVNGTTQFGVVRLQPNGTIDSRFVTQQPAPAPTHDFHFMAVQADGKIIGGAQGIQRLNADGSRDALYIADVGNIFALLMQPNSQLLVSEEFTDSASGARRNSVTRLNTDGTIDLGFAFDQEINDWATAMALQPDGKILIGGFFTQIGGVRRNHIARLNADGTLDTSFDPSTGVTGQPSVVFSIAIEPSGKILIGGEFASVNGQRRIRLARFNPNGSLDTSFDPGQGPNSFVEKVALLPNGQILAGGNFLSYNGVRRTGLARLNSDGSLDAVFNPRLRFPDVISVSSILVQPNGRIIIGGLFNEVNGVRRTAIARLIGDENLVSLASPKWTLSGSFQFTITTQPGRTYRVEASNDLANWQSVGTKEAAGITTVFEQTPPVGAEPRFFRAVLLPPAP